MALAALLSSSAASALSADLQKEYRAPTDAEVAANPALKDNMILDVTTSAGYGLDNVEALKSNLGREKARADSAESTVSAFGDLKPDDVKNKLEKLSSLEKLDPTKEADKIAEQKFEAMKADLLSQHENEKKPLKERADKLFSELDNAKRIQAATAAIVDAGGQPDVLLPHVLGSTKFVEKDGKFDVLVVDKEGNPRIGDAAGSHMSLTQLVDEFKTKDAFAPLFAASGATGGGARSTLGSTPTVGAKKSEMDLNTKAEYIEKNGMDSYLALSD
jgi:hypothetical protein